MSTHRPPPPRRQVIPSVNPSATQSDSPVRIHRTINPMNNQSISQSNNQRVRIQSNHQQIRTNGHSYDQSNNQSINPTVTYTKNLPNNQLNINLNSRPSIQPNNQSHSQSSSQSYNQEPSSGSSSRSSDSNSQPDYHRGPTVSRPFSGQSSSDRSNNQAINQSNNQTRKRKHDSPPSSPRSGNSHSTNGSGLVSTSQSNNPSHNQSVNQSLNRCLNLSISQSISQSTRKRYTRWQMDHPKLSMLVAFLIVCLLVGLTACLIKYFMGWTSDSKKLTGVVLFSIFQTINQSVKQSDPFLYASQMSALRSWDQTVAQSNIHVIVSSMDSCDFLYDEFSSVNCHVITDSAQSDDQSINQSSDQSINQLSMRFAFQQIHKSIEQLNEPTDRIMYVNNDVVLSHQSVIDAMNWIDQSIDQSLDQPVDQFSLIVGSAVPVGLTNNMVESINESIDQSINQLIARADIKQPNNDQSIDWFIYRKSAYETIKLSPGQQSNDQSIDHSLKNFPEFQFGSNHWKRFLVSKFLLDEDQFVIADYSIKSVRLINQSNKQTISQSVKQSIKQSNHHNENLIAKLNFVSPLNIGELKNFPYKLVDQSFKQSSNQNNQTTNQPINQLLVPSNSPYSVIQSVDQSINQLMFARRASANGYLTVLTINSGYIKLAMNWLCWAKRIGFENYILISEDYKSKELIDQSISQSIQKQAISDQSITINPSNKRIPMIIKPGSPYTKPAADYGSVEFQETMTFRTEFLMEVLQNGYHFITADMDGLWLDDPIQFFDTSADLSGQLHKEVKISGGFVVVRATPYGKFFWQAVIDCQRENSIFLAKTPLGSYEPSKYTEQYCINELSRSLINQSTFKRTLLDRWLFPDGKSFFDEFNSQLRGVHPVVIHNNWIKGADQKLGRLIDWNLNSADDDLQCIDLPPLPPLPAPIKEVHDKLSNKQPISHANNQLINPLIIPPPVHVKIRVLAFNRPNSLRILLKSLTDADYLNHLVTLEISIDHPNVNPSDQQVMDWQECLSIARDFDWKHGAKNVIEQRYNIGLIGQWIRGWQPEAIKSTIDPSLNQTNKLSSSEDSTVVFFLEDDCSVSPLFYHFLIASLNQYYLTPHNYDGRLFGISLQRQNRILGETHFNQYGSSIPTDTLARSSNIVDRQSINQNNQSIKRNFLLYRYQLIGTWGTVFFPSHWRAFQEWLTSKQVDINSGESANGFKPCVPALKSNEWYLQDPQKMWSQWFIRFAYEKGFYTLYTHFEGEKALVVNHREPGLNSAIKKDEIGNLITHVNELISTSNKQSSIDQSNIQITTNLYNSLPSMDAIPVYDFHFNHIAQPAILTWRQSISNPKYIDQCWTINQLSNLLRDRQLAFEAEQAEKQRIKTEKKRLADEANRARIKAEKEAKKLNATKLANATSTVKPINQSIILNTTLPVKTSVKSSNTTKSATVKKPATKPAAKPKKLKSLTGDKPVVDPVVAHTIEQTVEHPVEQAAVPASAPSDEQSTQSTEQPAEQVVEQAAVEPPSEQPVEQPAVAQSPEQPSEQSTEQPAVAQSTEQSTEQPSEQSAEQPAETPAEQAPPAESPAAE